MAFTELKRKCYEKGDVLPTISQIEGIYDYILEKKCWNLIEIFCKKLQDWIENLHVV